MSSNPTLKKQPSPFMYYFKWVVMIASVLLSAYLVMMMYAQGEYLFAIVTLVLLSSCIYIFSTPKAYAWRYVFPGMAGIGLFILFPLISTIAIGFTNYSNSNRLTIERATDVLLSQKHFKGENRNFSLYKNDQNWVLVLDSSNSDAQLTSVPFSFEQDLSEPIELFESNTQPNGEKATIRDLTSLKEPLNNLVVKAPNGDLYRKSTLRQFGILEPLFVLQADGESLKNSDTGVVYRPNMEIGFYQAIDEQGNWLTEKLRPGFTVNIGFGNFIQFFTDANFLDPFISIFIWTLIFSTLTVLFTTALGTVLACLVEWESLRGRSIYRLLLILPYAVPSFISILIFRGLFHQSNGEINQLLSMLFGVQLEWFNDPMLAKIMILVVNTWLGYPYMMILCMGLLKAIPEDLYEASALDGATPFQNFFKITLPLLIKPLTPLMIATFAFNFNNFVLIKLLTEGGPSRTDSVAPAGKTDILVSYTYRIAFEGGGGENFGLAAAISTIIFLLVGAIAIINMRATKMDFD